MYARVRTHGFVAEMCVFTHTYLLQGRPSQGLGTMRARQKCFCVDITLSLIVGWEPLLPEHQPAF